MRFAGKQILITGSTRGIGKAAAELFLAEGAEVILHGRREGEVQTLVRQWVGEYGVRVRGAAADLGDANECQTLAARAGDVDVLVNCAGIYTEVSVADTTHATWDAMIHVNATAPWLLAQALAPGLKVRKGIIVNVASDAALLGYAGSVAYCASKGAVVGLTRALAVELAPDIRVLCVCPGPTETDMMTATIAEAPDPEAARRHWASYTLLGRVAAPAEIGAAIVLAASPGNSYMTGSLIMADGGATAGKRV